MHLPRVKRDETVTGVNPATSGKTPSRGSSFAKNFALALMLVFPPAVFSGWAAQVVVTLRNGDRVSGDLLSEDTNQIVILSPFAGRIAFPKDAIAQRTDPPAQATRSTTEPVAATPTPPSPVPKPASTPAPRASSATAAPPPPKPTGLAALAPAALRPLFTNWHGGLNLGMDIGFGTSERRTFYLNGNATHTWDRVRDSFEYHVAYGVVNTVQSANRMDGAAKTEADLGVKRRMYVYNQGGAGYDEVRHIDLEFHEGAGLGYKVLQQKHLNLNTEVGLQDQNQSYRNQPRHSFVSARLGENIVWKPLDKLEIRQALTYTPDIEDFTVVRIRAELSLSYPLFKRITFNFNLVDLYDSQPPIGVKNNDLQVQSTIGMTF